MDTPERIPSYKVIKELHRHEAEGAAGVQTLVKLSKEHIIRKVGQMGYVETEYVVVGTASVTKTDATGTFHYEETIVTASDEEGATNMAILYLAPRVLSIAETMWVLGEI
jgi:hypothetical protein